MDFKALKDQLEAQRLFETAVDGITFRLKLPTDHAWRVVLQQQMNGEGKVIHALACRALCEASLIGWSGVTAGHFGAEPATELVEFSLDFRAELLETRPDLGDEIFIALADRRSQRAEKLETERKNS